MSRLLSLAALAALALLSACGPSHQLARYDFAGKEFMFRPVVASDASRVRIDIENPTPGGTVGAIVAGIGSDVLSGGAESKLHNAVRPIGVASAINSGVQRTVETYLSGTGVDAAGERTDFVVETVLRQCDVVSRATGVFLRVEALCMLIDRRTGEEIWDEAEAVTSTITFTPSGAVPVPGVATAASVVNAVRFFAMSEKEIQDAVLAAATDVGEVIGRRLREDYAGSRKR